MTDDRENATTAFPTRRQLREEQRRKAVPRRDQAPRVVVDVPMADTAERTVVSSTSMAAPASARSVAKPRLAMRWLPRVAVLGSLALATTGIPLSGAALPASSDTPSATYAAASALDVLAQDSMTGSDATVDPAAPLAADPLAAARALLAADRTTDREVLQCGSSELEANGQVAAEATTEPIQVMMPLTSGSYRITSHYGPRWGGKHEGLDFAAPPGTPIHAVAAGEVTYVGYGLAGRSGMIIVLKHEIDGEFFWTWYIHSYPDGIFVDVGDQVGAGDVIGEVGNYGNSTGPHLHLEVHVDEDYTTVNPANWLSEQSAATITTQNLACAAD
ncbi:MAG: M23 family metallopeptidase [Beutenbergiaceae bacterium]